jgi:hypothetical protein
MDNTLAKDVIYFKCCRAIALSTIRSNRHFLIMAPTAPVWCWFAFYSSYGYDLKANRWVLWYAAMVSMLTIAHTFSHHSLSNRKFAKLTMSLLVFRDNLKCMVIIHNSVPKFKTHSCLKVREQHEWKQQHWQRGLTTGAQGFVGCGFGCILPGTNERAGNTFRIGFLHTGLSVE